MKKIHIFAASLAMLLPAIVWAGGDSTTYYAALKAQVSSTGGGKVYAGTSNSAPSANSYKADSSQSSNQSSTTENESKNFYAFASADEGYEFSHWSTSNGGTSASTENPYTVAVKCSSSTESSPTLTTVYAIFNKKTLAAFGITFEITSAGTYTVDEAAPANKTGLTEATTVVLKSTDANFLNWVVNGTVVNDNPYTATCLADTTISAEFLTADQVTTAITLADLTAALSNAAYKKITIPSGTSITVEKGSSVTVPAGKQLVVDGTLNVLGTVSNSGVISGSGTLYKISYLIDQGEVITVKTADGKECGAMTCACQDSKMPRYCKTTVTQNSPSVNGTVSCTTSWGVLLNGTTAYAISKQSPKAVKVSLDTAKDSNGKQSVVNKITAITADTDTVNENANYVLFADMTMTGPLDSSKLRSTATVDCAGKKLSAGTNSHSSFGISVLNGSFSASASQWQNAHAAFFNVSSVSLSKVKGTGSTYYFYDCGTKASPCSISITYYSSTRTSDYKTAYFYSGYYSYSFNTTNDSGKCNVYGGSYTSDPASYIPSAYDGILQSKYDGSKYYVVTDYTPPTYVCAVGEVEFESLPEAVATAGNGSLITLSAAIELTETLTIPAGKNITISLEKHTIQGGKIVNNGTLTITDSATGNGTYVTDASGGIVKSDIENNGTLDFIFGSYTGAIVNKAGTLTTHNGLFSGTLAKNGGTVNLKGGHFTAEVSSFVTAVGYDVITYGGKNSVCELPNGTLYDTTIKSTAGYGATPYGASDYNLLVKWVGGKGARTDYSTSEWSRLAELLCYYQVFNSKGLDPTLVFDRDVARNSVNLYAKSGSQEIAVDFDLDVSAGTPYRALSEFLNPKYASKTFKAIFSESISSVGIAVSDKSGNNKGTVCKAMVEIWSDDRASDYSSTGHKLTNTVYVVGQKIFTLGAGSNAAMIRPATGAATFYATLGAAMDAAASGDTVMLANDCATALPLTKAGTYTFDTMGFAHSDEVVLAEGLSIQSATPVTSSVESLIDGAVATTYVVVEESAATKVDVPTAVSGLVYDGTVKTGVAAGTGYTLSGNTATAAGTYTATATLAANYAWSDDSTGTKTIEWSIGKATVAVTAEAKTQVYGAETVALTYTAGDLVAGNSFSGSLAREAGDGVGTYAITQGTLSAGDNYTINFTGANYTITAIKIAVPTAVSDLTYDGTEQTGVMAGTGYTLSGNTATAAGTYTATATLAANYAWSDDSTGTKTIEWSIAAKAATITVASASKVYGEADPAFTGTVEGLVNANDLGTITYVRTGTDANVGTYNGVLTANYTPNGNYAVTVVPAALTITAAKATVPTVVSGLIYDGTEKTGVAAGTGYTLSGNTATAAGTYTATATLAANYVWSDGTTNAKSVEWSIGKATVAVTAEAKTQVYGAEAVALTYTAGDLVAGNSFSGSLAREAGDGVGTYAITQGTLSAGDNYTIHFTGANYTITAAKVSVPTAVANLTYDGTEKTGVAGGTGYTLSGNTATAAGTYTATATLVANYVWSDDSTGTKTIEWSIGKATVAVTAEAKTQVYGAEALALTYTAGDLVAGNSFSGSLAREAGDGVGTYAITQGTLSAGDNYTINFTGANYTITAAKVAVPTAASGLVYDGTEKTGVAAGTGYTLSGTTAATEAGTYTATATLEANYEWTDGTTDPKTITWSIDDAELHVTGIVPGTLRFTSVKASGRKVTVTFEFTPNGKNADDYRLIYKTAIDSKETFVSDIADVTVIDGDANSRTAIAEVILPEACEPQAFVTGLDFTEEE